MRGKIITIGPLRLIATLIDSVFGRKERTGAFHAAASPAARRAAQYKSGPNGLIEDLYVLPPALLRYLRSRDGR